MDRPSSRCSARINLFHSHISSLKWTLMLPSLYIREGKPFHGAEPPAFGPVLWSTSVSGLTEAVSLPLTSASLAPPQGDNHPYALCLNFFFKVLWPGIGLDLLSIRQSIYISYLFSLRQLWEAEHSDVKRQHYRAAGAKSKCERFRARGGEGGSQENKD